MLMINLVELISDIMKFSIQKDKFLY